MQKVQTQTSWHGVGKWYNASVGDRGHYYHEHVVIPGVTRLLALKSGDSLLDVACGQGVLARAIPNEVSYVGIDVAKSLIDAAKTRDKNNQHRYLVGDVTKPLPLEAKKFSHAAIILALQNIEFPKETIKNVGAHMLDGGKLVIVLNHPCFRIPRQSSWGIEETTKTQYRKINRYLSPLKIPITMHPGQASSALTWSYHEPLSFYVKAVHDGGFCITDLEEWTSDKESVGKAGKMENRARSEFPLFLTLVAKKPMS